LTEVCTQFEEIQREFESNYFHPNWQVRRQLISCFGRLITRGIVSSEFVSTELRDKFLHTSNGFEMNFLLKEEIRSVFQREKQQELASRLQQLLLSNTPDGQTREEYVNEQLQTLVDSAKQGKVVINITDVLQKMIKEKC